MMEAAVSFDMLVH